VTIQYMVYCGSLDTMELIAKRGVKGLNPKTHKWQVVDKDAQYEVKEINHYVNDEGAPYACATLYADRNMREIAKGKGLIL
jgi:phage-related protein